MLRKTALKEVPVGTTFEVWNRKYTVLDKANDRVLCLAAEIEEPLPFRDDDMPYKVAPNDFRDSSIRDWLNCEYLGALMRDGLQNGQILDMDVDLKCTLGQHEYGKGSVMVGLLTLEEYGRYYDIIPKIDSAWWLATPWKTPGRPPYASHLFNGVWVAYSNGDYGCSSCRTMFGVRPVLTFSPSLLVAWDGEYDGGDWDGYIKYLHKWAVEHDDAKFAGCVPATYQEWQDCENEVDEDESNGHNS